VLAASSIAWWIASSPFNASRNHAGRGLPLLKFSWVLMRSNLDEVLDLVELARRVGAAEIYLRHLVPFAELDVTSQLIFDMPHTTNHVLDEAWERTRRYGIRMTTLPKLPPGRLDLRQRLTLAYEQAREIGRDEGLGGVLAWPCASGACARKPAISLGSPSTFGRTEPSTRAVRGSRKRLSAIWPPAPERDLRLRRCPAPAR